MAVDIDTPTVDILGTPIHQITRRDLFALLQRRFTSHKATWVVTVNAELVVRARESKEVADCLSQADLLLADGSGIIWAARTLGGYLPEKLPGVEIAEDLVKWAAGAGLSVYFLGAEPGVAQQAAAKLQSKYPGLKVAGYHHGYFQSEEREVVAEISELEPDILLVALGAPRQEFWLAEHFHNLPVAIAVGVGGSFDVWSGRVRRAPAWMSNHGLEWLYRLVTDPRRARRMLALPQFVYQVVGSKLTGR